MLREGLLWFDDDPARDLEAKVARAAQQYQAKHGRRPNVCYVHPAALDDGATRSNGVRVEPLASVLRHHFWVGEESSAGQLVQGTLL